MLGQHWGNEIGKATSAAAPPCHQRSREVLARRTRLETQVSLALRGATSDSEVDHWDRPRHRSHGWSQRCRARVRDGSMREVPALQAL